MTGLFSLNFIDFFQKYSHFWQQEKRVDEKLHFKTVSERMKLLLIKNMGEYIFLEVLFTRMRNWLLTEKAKKKKKNSLGNKQPK